MLRQNGRAKKAPLRQLNAQIMYVMANLIQLNGMQRRFKALIATAECWIVSRAKFVPQTKRKKGGGSGRKKRHEVKGSICRSWCPIRSFNVSNKSEQSENTCRGQVL